MVVEKKTSGTVRKHVQKLLVGQVFSTRSTIFTEKNYMFDFGGEGGSTFINWDEAKLYEIGHQLFIFLRYFKPLKSYKK